MSRQTNCKILCGRNQVLHFLDSQHSNHCVHCISELYGGWMICVFILSNPKEQKYQF